MKYQFFLIVVLVGLLILGCKKDSTGIEDTDDDPNNEEQLLGTLKADEGPGVVKVMSRNVYVGTDVDMVLEATDPNTIPFFVKAAYEMLLATDYYARADALAEEIEKTLPHVVGLQEMSKTYLQAPGDFLEGNPQPASDLQFDFFDILMTALEARGLNYTLAVSVQNADVEVPMFPLVPRGDLSLDDVRLVDHDAILVRDDVTYSNPVSVSYDSMLVIKFDEALGITIPRGYVAVDVQVGQTAFVFANTHLEAVPDIPLRMGQATQLLNAMADETLPVIIVGDFNSRAPIGTTYQYVLSQGYTDAWDNNTLTYNPNGYTFGHESALTNEDVNFFERIDFVFVKAPNAPTYGESFVLGDELRDRTSSGLWPSDHGGVVTKLTFPIIAKLAAR